MMTKYQIIVTKLETTVNNITRTTEARKILRQKRALLKLADHVRQTKQKTANKQKLVYMHFENKIAAMTAAFERYTVLKSMHGSFSQWRKATTLTGQAEKIELEGRERLADLENNIANGEKESKLIQQKLAATQAESEQTNLNLAKAETSLKDLDQRNKKMQEKMQNAESQAQRSAAESRTRANNEIRQKIKRIEAQIKTQREENSALLSKQEMTNYSIGDYISEMSTMLSSAELESALAMEHIDSQDSDEQYEEQQQQRPIEEMEFEADEGRPHAGTGGSSKLRSRPQNQHYSHAGV